MKNVTPLKKEEKVELSGGFGFDRICTKPYIEIFDPKIIGWLDEGPNGEQHFPG